MSCGISKSGFLNDEAERFENWLKNNYHGTMSYMERNFDKRLDTTKLVEGSKSVISLLYNYYPKKKQNPNSYKISKYAYGIDYHYVIKDKLKNPGAAKEMRKRTYFSTAQVNGYLTAISYNNNPSNSLSILLRAEQSLNITNSYYKALRRTIHNFDSISTTEKKKNVTRLLYASRAKLRSSDIIDDLEKLAVEGNFETGLVKDNEPTISLPDLPIETKDTINYKFLVGTKNLMQAQRFINLASKGASIPGNFVAGYLPIIKMVHDIVRAGPAFINQLRVLHKRAQKSTKE